MINMNQNREKLEQAIKIINSFEKGLQRFVVTPNKTYKTYIKLEDIPENVDYSEFLIEVATNSNRYVNNSVANRVFTINEHDELEYIVEFSDNTLGFKSFLVPFNATIEDYIATVER